MNLRQYYKNLLSEQTIEVDPNYLSNKVRKLVKPKHVITDKHTELLRGFTNGIR